MVRWSGAGRICWTSSPAGIRGKRCLGKYDFRRGATFLLCAHPAPERRPRGTETAGEPIRGRLRPEARAGRTSGGDRARRDVALSEKKSEPLWVWKAWD